MPKAKPAKQAKLHHPPTQRYSQAVLAEAVMRVKAGEISLRRAAIQYNLPRTTVWDKVTGKTTFGCKKGPNPYMTAEEEKRLAEWVVKMADMGHERTRGQILEMAQKIIRQTGRKTPFKNDKPGVRWFTTFLKRNPVLATRSIQVKGREKTVITGSNLDLWFRELEDFLHLKKARSLLDDPSRIWSASESVVLLCREGNRVTGMKEPKFLSPQELNDQMMVTTFVAASATGKCCSPCIVYPGQKVFRRQMSDSAIYDTWMYCLSDSGRMSPDHLYSWLVSHFQPHLLRHNIPAPVLLFVEGTMPHLSGRVEEFCVENDILVYRLPEDSPRFTYPKIPTIFSPLRKTYLEYEKEWMAQHPEEYLTKETFIQPFSWAWDVMRDQPQLLCKGFTVAGIFPFTGASSPDCQVALSQDDSCVSSSTDAADCLMHENTSNQPAEKSSNKEPSRSEAIKGYSNSCLDEILVYPEEESGRREKKRKAEEKEKKQKERRVMQMKRDAERRVNEVRRSDELSSGTGMALSKPNQFVIEDRCSGCGKPFRAVGILTLVK